jgi:hypothetical protein
MRAGVICRSFSVLSPVPTARHCEFAVRIETFLVRGGAREDGLLYTMAEQVRPHIDFGRVAKPARAQLEVPESFAVGAEGSVVVHSARQVRPSGGFRFALAVSNFRLRARLDSPYLPLSPAGEELSPPLDTALLIRTPEGLEPS